jgi:type IV fimbrial biogenesis protein FimT
MKTTSKLRNSGFTLIEALITISIASILASIAIPSFSKMIESNRISSASNEFLSALMFARSEAAKRSITVSICGSTNGLTCDSPNDYAAGWLVFTDCAEDSTYNSATVTTCDLDGNGTNDPDLLLRVQQPIKSVSIVGTSAALDTYSYRFSGRPPNPASFSIGPEGTTATKKISVARTGRVRLEDY